MSNNNYKHFLQSVDMQRIYKKHHHGFDRNRIMSCRGISSKPSMLGKSGINNGTISCCMSLSQVGQFNLYSGFLHCGQSCKFEAQEKRPKYHPQFLQNCTKFGLLSKQTMHLKDSFIFSRTLISFINYHLLTLISSSLTSYKISLMHSSIGKFKAGAGETTQSPVSVKLKLRKFNEGRQLSSSTSSSPKISNKR